MFLLDRSSCFDNVSEKESIQLLTQATQTLRNQYILKQKLAGDAISKRVRLLTEQKVQLIDDLQALEQFRYDVLTKQVIYHARIALRRTRPFGDQFKIYETI